MIFLLPLVHVKSVFPVLYCSVKCRGVTVNIGSTSLWWDIGGFKITYSKPCSVCTLSCFPGSRQAAWEMEKTW